MKYILTIIMVALLSSTALADTSVDLDGNGHIDEAFGGTNVGSVYSPTVQSADPTVDSDNGIYFATTSQKMFIKDDTFLWASSVGTYTLIEEVVVPEYTLNLNISGVTGADAINGFTTSQVITGLTSDYTLTGTLGDSTDLACTGTGVTGSGLSYLAGTASADVTADCVFSVTSSGISDDFSTDTSSNYTTIVGGGLAISGGYATSASAWADTAVYSSTSTGDDNHYVEADLDIKANDKAGVVFAYSPSNGGYIAVPTTSGITISTLTAGGTASYLSKVGGVGVVDEISTLRVEVSGTTATIFYKGVSVGTQAITVQGQYVGLFIYNSSNQFARVDSFSGGAL